MSKTPKTIDDLFEMARTDPDALEQYRQQQIREIISQAPPYMRHRLRGLQFTIDAKRRKHPNPLASCIQISNMMHESFGELRQLLNSLPSRSEQKTGSDTQKTGNISNHASGGPTAKVIPFPSRSN